MALVQKSRQAKTITDFPKPAGSRASEYPPWVESGHARRLTAAEFVEFQTEALPNLGRCYL
jgi:hypothetical protein